MTKQKHTPGPLSVSTGTKWPFYILITNESGNVVYQESLPCHSSKDNSFYEALHCLNFKSSEREQYAAINMRALADAHLRAAAPDLLEALERLVFAAECRDNTSGDAVRLVEVKTELAAAAKQARIVIAKATGGSND